VSARTRHHRVADLRRASAPGRPLRRARDHRSAAAQPARPDMRSATDRCATEGASMKRVFSQSIARRVGLLAFAGLSAAAFAKAPAAPVPTAPDEPAHAAPLTPAPSATTPGAPASAPAPGPAARPFREVVKDAKETEGFFNVWRDGDRAWIEIRPDQLDKPFFFTTVRTKGVGERMVIAGLMGERHIVYFKKVNGPVQLIARNTRFRARAGTPTEHAVHESFSDSLLASAPIASGPNPKGEGILVEVNALLLNDIPGAATL